MKKLWLALVILTGIWTATPTPVHGHCEIPCGIYGDKARFGQMREDIKTIEKSMKMILELTSKPSDAQAINQVVRWVNNKEAHADKLRHTVTQYFQTQRVKPVGPDSKKYKNYVQHLVHLHQIIFYAMKCKQTLELGHVKKLNDLVDSYEKLYFQGHKHSHKKTDKKTGPKKTSSRYQPLPAGKSIYRINMPGDKSRMSLYVVERRPVDSTDEMKFITTRYVGNVAERHFYHTKSNKYFTPLKAAKFSKTKGRRGQGNNYEFTWPEKGKGSMKFFVEGKRGAPKVLEAKNLSRRAVALPLIFEYICRLPFKKGRAHQTPLLILGGEDLPGPGGAVILQDNHITYLGVEKVKIGGKTWVLNTFHMKGQMGLGPKEKLDLKIYVNNNREVIYATGRPFEMRRVKQLSAKKRAQLKEMNQGFPPSMKFKATGAKVVYNHLFVNKKSPQKGLPMAFRIEKKKTGRQNSPYEWTIARYSRGTKKKGYRDLERNVILAGGPNGFRPLKVWNSFEGVGPKPFGPQIKFQWKPSGDGQMTMIYMKKGTSQKVYKIKAVPANANNFLLAMIKAGHDGPAMKKGATFPLEIIAPSGRMITGLKVKAHGRDMIHPSSGKKSVVAFKYTIERNNQALFTGWYSRKGRLVQFTSGQQVFVRAQWTKKMKLWTSAAENMREPVSKMKEIKREYFQRR